MNFIDRVMNFIDRVMNFIDRVMNFIDALIPGIDPVMNFIDRVMNFIDRVMNFIDGLIPGIDRVMNFIDGRRFSVRSPVSRVVIPVSHVVSTTLALRVLVSGVVPRSLFMRAFTLGEHGVDRQTGTLENGKLADIVAVPGNPLVDIRQTENVVFVMRAGHVYKKPASH